MLILATTSFVTPEHLQLQLRTAQGPVSKERHAAEGRGQTGPDEALGADTTGPCGAVRYTSVRSNNAPDNRTQTAALLFRVRSQNPREGTGVAGRGGACGGRAALTKR